MDDNLVLPTFPLPNVIFFPRTMLPLHIFEPRYRQMIKDLEERSANERLVIIANLDQQNLPKGKNPFEEIATIGKLVHVEYLEDGRSNIVLHGQFTAKVKEVIPSPRGYRMAKIEDIREEYWSDPLSDQRQKQQKLMTCLNDFMDRTNTKIQNLDEVSLDDLINGLAFSLNIDSDNKQELLEVQELDKRLDKLVEIIDKIGYYSEYVPDEDGYTGIN